MNGVALIPLFWHGHHVTDALVDEDDWPRLAKFRWTTSPVHRMTREWGYASRSSRVPDPACQLSMERDIHGLGKGDAKSVHHVNQVKWDNRRENLVVYETRNAHQIVADHRATQLDRIRFGRDLLNEARASLGLEPFRLMSHREITTIRGDGRFRRPLSKAAA